MLSSNSKPNPQQPRFRLLRICFARKSDCKTKNPLPEADFLCRNVGESADYANFAEVQAAKTSSHREQQIASCETVLPSGAANCRLRNRPPVGSGKLQAAKTSSHRERQIASCENVLPSGATNCRLRKRPPVGSGKLQQSTVGAYRIRPNTYAMTSGRIQGVCDTPLHRFLLNNH